MRPFRYVRAEDEARAVALATLEPRAQFLAGGTSIVELMKLDIERPDQLVDIGGLPHVSVAEHGRGVMIGAFAKNSDVAEHPLIKSRYPVLSEALLAGASPQLRNMATIGGNLLQRTRCAYFREATSPCNKREPGSGCPAREGDNRSHALLGGSEHCIAAHPSDMCVALAALDAVIHTRGARGERAIPIDDFHVLPGARPDVEHVLEHGELITAVELPASELRSTYLKISDRISYPFALAAVAVAIEQRAGKICDARVALGGVATKPWRCREAERVLIGQAPNIGVYRAAASAALEPAVPLEHNRFKVQVTWRLLVRALSAVAPHSGA